MNTTAAEASGPSAFNSTPPTSSVFSVGTNAATNGSGNTNVAYCFAEVAGFSKFGKYTGNGSADGPFVWCGFRPRWVLTKRTDSAGEDWQIHDTARTTYNVDSTIIYNTVAAEQTGTTFSIDVLASGFKLRTLHAGKNASGGTYIFAAFAEHPFKTARAR